MHMYTQKFSTTQKKVESKGYFMNNMEIWYVHGRDRNEDILNNTRQNKEVDYLYKWFRKKGTFCLCADRLQVWKTAEEYAFSTSVDLQYWRRIELMHNLFFSLFLIIFFFRYWSTNTDQDEWNCEESWSYCSISV